MTNNFAIIIPSMKRPLKRLLLLILTITLIGISVRALWYLNTTYLPRVIKTLIIDKAADRGITARIANIRIHPFKGFIVSQLSFTDPAQEKELLFIEQLTTKPFLLPLFKKQLIFPSVTIDGARLSVVRDEAGALTLQQFFSSSFQPSKTSISAFIYSLNIYESTLGFENKNTQFPLELTAELKKAQCKILPSGISFSLQGNLSDATQSTPLESTGEFHWNTQELNATMNLTNLDFLPYLSYFKKPPFQSKRFPINTLQAKFTIKDKQLSCALNAQLTDADIVIQQFSFSQVNADAALSLRYNMAQRKLLDYQITLHSVRADSKETQQFPAAHINNAQLTINADTINFTKIPLVALNIPIALTGKLVKTANRPSYSFTARAEIQLPTLQTALSDYRNINSDFLAAEGTAQVVVAVEKSPHNTTVQVNGSADLTDAILKLKNKDITLEHLNGTMQFSQNSVRWDNIAFDFLDHSLTSSATISEFKHPRVHLSLSGKELSVASEFNFDKSKKEIHVEAFDGKWHNSILALKTIIDVNSSSVSIKNARFKSRLDLKDLTATEFLRKKLPKKLKPMGSVTITGRLQGNVQSPEKLLAYATATSATFSLYDLQFSKTKMEIAYETGQLKIPSFTGLLYEGNIEATGLIDLLKQHHPFAVRINATDVNLAHASKDLPFVEQTYAGTLDATCVLNGSGSTLDALKGQCALLIRDGNLWEFNPLQGLGEFLFIPRYSGIVFKEANGNFVIIDRKIITEDLVMKSNALALSGEGSLDFDGNLDFRIVPRALASISSELGKIEGYVGGIFSEIGGIAVVELTGTVKKPKFNKRIIAGEFLKRLKGLIFGGNE